MVVKSGLSGDTAKRILVDAGAVYFNYGLPGERLLGATRGGNEFNPGRTIKDIEVDGVKGSTKGLRRVAEVRPQLTCNLIELSLDNLLKAIAGANQAEAAKQIAVEAEYVEVGDNSKVLFDLDHGDIVEKTEKIYINATLKSRSKKYLSRFVGANAVNNKEFESGYGNWTKGHDDDVIEIATGGKSGNCLKYTGSASSVVGFLTLPGGNGAQLTNLVVGQHYRIQIALTKLAGAFTPTITLACDAGSKAAVAPTTAWIVHVIEFVATGTDASITLTASVAPTGSDILYVDFLELERVDGDYVMNWDKGEVIFPEDDVPTDTEYITAGYTYKTGADATHDIITGGDIGDEDYIDNVALVGNISGKTQAVICIVKNALADAGFSLATAPRDEAVPSIIFTGHYDPDDPDAEPWEVHYPRA